MAEVPYTKSSLVPQVLGNNVAIYTWTLTGSDSGQPIQGPGYTDRSFQLTGVFGGTVVIEGSNDGVNYVTLTDPFDNPLSFAAAALKQLLQICLWLRPRASGVNSVVVTAVCCNHNPN